MNAVHEPPALGTEPTYQDAVQSACRRIPPLWPLKHFVAVNPFVGLTDRQFITAARLLQRVGHGDILMPAEYYREQIASGRIRDEHVRSALAVARKSLPPIWAERIGFASREALDHALAASTLPPATERVLTFADFLDARAQSAWSGFVVEEISKWCSAYYDEGQSSWRMPWRNCGLFAAWKEAARLDANPELCGLKRFREIVATLPDDSMEVIKYAITALAVPNDALADFLHRQLMSIPGWSGHVQFRVREHGMAGKPDDSLAQLVAIRLAYDIALRNQFGDDPELQAAWARQIGRVQGPDEDYSPNVLARHVAQLALECGYQGSLIAKLKANTGRPTVTGRKSLQAIFCIDVRSEVYRRSLEAQSDEIQTIGFAGFFGMAFEYLRFGRPKGGAQCPVLLTPKIRLRETIQHAGAEAERALLKQRNLGQTVNRAWNSFKSSAISCFSFVETAGLWFGVKLAKDSLALANPEVPYAASGGHQRFGPRIDPEACSCEDHGHDCETGIKIADQIAMAAGALKNMGLTSDFAKVVLVCGHGSATTNNPYGSALDCGACGGHAGDANARVAAGILNQPAVRDGLKQMGIHIPSDTVFVAGLHNTTTDEILLYDLETLPAKASAQLTQVREWLEAASAKSRRERSETLGLADIPEAELASRIFGRSRDWAQVRPEWGLANNAAFIAAPRERTKGLDLGGRVFLHNYDARQDGDLSVLELIMVAPMVVASWINLQYYGSTVNNRLFGSGNKVIHNVVGTFGVWQGNGGDLQPGLPLQSLHDGTRWIHEPLRLSVFIEAERNAIRKIIDRQPGVRELIENGWITLFAVEDAGKGFWRYNGNGFSALAE